MKTKIIQNWKSGITVSLVSIPLALALAITSGATPTQGIITAFWAGLLGGIFGGSDFNIIGPTGALAGILVTYTLKHGYQTLPMVALLTGLIILLAYTFRLDKYIIFIPRSVIHGFTLGVAFIIGFGQLDNALGLAEMAKTDNFIQNTVTILKNYHSIHWGIFLLFLLSAIFIIFWNKKFPKFPGSAIVAFISIGFIAVFQHSDYHCSILTLGDKYPDIMSILYAKSFQKSDLSMLMTKDIWSLSIITAVIAVLETLLSGQIADKLTGTKFNRRQEVLGLSIANIGSGLMGGIPATAALARTALNIKSGANSKFSAIINSLFVGIITVFCLKYFKLLPMFVVASILVVTAIGMVEKQHFIHLIENEKIAFLLAMFVSVIVVIVDPMSGIIVGTAIALLIFVYKLSYGQTEVLLWKNGKMSEALLKHDFLKKEVIDSDIVVYKISGTLTYVNMPAHLEAVQKIKHNKYVIISLRHAFYADIDGIDYLEEIIELLKKNNQTILLSGVNKEIIKLIHKKTFYKRKHIEQKIYNRTSEAINDIMDR